MTGVDRMLREERTLTPNLFRSRERALLPRGGRGGWGLRQFRNR